MQIPHQIREKLHKNRVSSRKQPMGMMRLRNTLTMVRHCWKNVAIHDGNFIKVISQNTSCKQSCDTPTNNQSMTTSVFLYAHHRLVANIHASIPFFPL